LVFLGGVHCIAAAMTFGTSDQDAHDPEVRPDKSGQPPPDQFSIPALYPCGLQWLPVDAGPQVYTDAKYWA
jgi:hypothetical protein